MSNFEIPNNPELNLNMRKLETSDPGHADTFNSLFLQLLINTAALNIKCNKALELVLGLEYDPENESLSLTYAGGDINPGTGGTYVLQPATDSRLGGVKIGDGIDGLEDGTISIDTGSIASKAAQIAEENTEEFSDEEISEIFKSV